ncbi:MAG: 50S ribosomal protein L22 [Bacteroides sp. SM1_62]|nr:MAG: 50S ribosomal protein L22 [Bacteroides sp. SM23_62]KPL22169.1 MAG: 50S ribosomal protein L22 [Bacteroides sp. SM1_62]
MGVRKRNRANQIKEDKQKKYFAVLKNCPTSPRKMRLVADLVRGEDVNRALDILKFSQKEASRKLEKLILSAISNWQTKNEGVRIEDSSLYVKEVYVDSARILKRLRPAPQGRAHRIRKRSNHVTVVLDSAITNES